MTPSEKASLKERIETLGERFTLSEDYRGRLPSYLSRFTGYKPPNAQPPYTALGIPPFSWLKYLPLKLEICIFTWIGAFGGILLIEAIMSANTAFSEVYHAPIIITSFGASAVLLFSAIESPLAQPRNFVLGHFVSALVGTCITRLFVLDPNYHIGLDEGGFHANVFVNGGLSMATSALAQVLIGAVHPPAGATGLNAAVQSEVVTLSWRYLPVILASSLIMLGWALIINNVGRRRYPVFWWKPGKVFVSATKEQQSMERAREARELETALRVEEGATLGDEEEVSEAGRPEV
ncbi:uncharacterized protein TRIVIDRAFT_60083 [Trichoderma virens Gv29-8]|uniref:HPP transmembrane region domain-containing protein n=1 Tax=Hypocrea virens (strain Gv29-8 / FGSC 10586) TaxID=413071 RepID=G9MT64_HYPVG|nr:uncharacterized protein TRIVIDRAFT_60083 [Trichoderma virens Gv29-8]EHK23106.1 hypothetical protein TRIVIDRAFT_60083 [Trichoderma virens Gv29-8]UKZ48167.1 hypothetical protein TrVGV298_002403 [Trichoderma virens]UKZ74706.1 hypothetical protein TrVFT333_002376 [Trichoderma virens FT-333]